MELPGGVSLPALLVDISYGGAGIETARAVESLTDFELVMLHGETPLRLPCTARHVRSVWAKHMVHTAFRELTAEQRAAVERVIEELTVAPEVAPGGRWVAFRRQIVRGRTSSEGART